MDVVLGVSMAPSSVRVVLVEGRTADGLTVDRDSFDVDAGTAAPDQVLAAILGTREGAAEGGHHLTSTGVAWTDHDAAARLRQSLRANGVEDVVLVSELHAAGALAQVVGQSLDYDRTALLVVQRDAATLAVVRTTDGAVVRVEGRDTDTGTAELAEMVAALGEAAEAPEAVFVLGTGIDVAEIRTEIERRTGWPVHAPDDGEFALARGAALAAANTPRYDATTVGLVHAEDTAAGPTQLAAAGYMAPLGYSAVIDDEDLLDGEPLDGAPVPTGDPGRRPFVVAGGALSGFLVVGLVALTISLAVVIRPAADQRPDPTGNAVVPVSQTPASAGRDPAAPAVLETIPAPIPVVQEAPRTVVVTPPAAARQPAPAAPAPAPAANAPAPTAPAPVAPAPVAPAPAAPVPAPIVAPIVVPIPIGSLLPSILAPSAVGSPVPRTPATTQTTQTTQAPTPTTSTPPPSTTTPPADSETAESTAASASASTSTATDSSSSAQTAEAPVTTTSAPAGGESSSTGSESSGSVSSAGDSGWGGSSDSAGSSSSLLPIGG